MIQALLNHLWQSTLVVIVVGVWAWALHEHRARLRYWLWFSAVAKFLVPFSLLIGLGSHLAPHASFAAQMAPVLSRVVSPAPRELDLTLFSASARPVTVPSSVVGPDTRLGHWAPYLLAVWICGIGFILGRWTIRWWRLRRTLKESVPLSIDAPIAVRAAPTAMEPGVVGVLKPVLVLPHAIEEHLSTPQLRAVLLHELEHVRCRDNLTASLCMLVQAIFWFYPLLWWLGGRLMVERESACDQAVLAAGCDRETYAQGIVNVCKLYVESPLACATGIAGADLRRRIESIMTDHPRRALGASVAALLSLTAASTLLLPVILGGALNAIPAAAQAQELAADPTNPVGGNSGIVVTGAPFSAVATQELTREFTDGNRAVRTVRVIHFYRDSAGRTRLERALSVQASGAEPKAELQNVAIQIRDPIRGELYLLSPRTKTAVVLKRRVAPQFIQPPLMPLPITAYYSGLKIGPTERGWSEPESLGDEVMEGVLVIGTRRTYTLAAGAVGNEKPIGMTIEQWFSPDLGMIVSKTGQAATGGGSNYRLSQIVQGDPDPSLFAVPSDYTIRQASRNFN